MRSESLYYLAVTAHGVLMALVFPIFFIMFASYRSWRREHAGVPVWPSMHGMLATVIIWYLATSGLAIEVVGMLIPWSLGMVDKIDPMLARIYFCGSGTRSSTSFCCRRTCCGTTCSLGLQAGGSSAIG